MFLSFFTIFFVSVIIVVLISSSNLVPFIFFSMSELQSGQVDLLLKPIESSPSNFLNYTLLNSTYSDSKAVASPRFDFDVKVYNAKLCQGFDPNNPFDSAPLYSGSAASSEVQSLCRNNGTSYCLQSICSSSSSGKMYAIDSNQEKSSGMGRNWPFAKMDANRIILDRNMAKYLELKEDDYCVLAINGDVISKLLAPLQVDSSINWDKYFALTFKVSYLTSDWHGKIGLYETNSMFVEYSHLFSSIMNALPPYYNGTLQEKESLLSSTSLYDSAMYVLVNFASGRLNFYGSSNVYTIAEQVVGWGSDFLDSIGSDFIKTTYPLLSLLQLSVYFTSFMSFIVTIAITIFIIISCFLLYSLLTVSVETKTFQYGLLRILGETKKGVILIITIKAIMIAVPATALGLLMGSFGFAGLQKGLSSFLKITVSSSISGISVILALIAGILVPFLVSLAASRNAFRFNALGGKGSQILATPTRAPIVPFWLIQMSLTVILFAIIVCYVMVDSLSNFNFGVYLTVLFFIMMSMIYGCINISMNLLYFVQVAVSKIIFLLIFIEKKSISLISTRNLLVHKGRNRQTSIMYATCLAFIVFMSLSIEIQLSSVIYGYQIKLIK